MTVTGAGYPVVPDRFEARVGLTLKGKWRLDRLLGVGGMASVYAATHRNNKRVAVKMLHAELSMNPTIRQRFLREGYVANSVGHSGAVSVDDDDITEDGCAFLVMELLEGETLEARWERRCRRLEPTEVLAVMDQVLETLRVAHLKGVVHRDLKPENLFLTQAGHMKILDFGIARLRELSAGVGHTQNGGVMGTPGFMPPEQARGHWDQVDGASDLWAVGATMFTLLTGRLVHPSATANEALVLAATQRASSVANAGVAIPYEVAGVVDRALAFEKTERWSNATEMQEAVREAYAAITKRPITLLDAVEDDIPAGQAELEGLAASNRMTAIGGIVATHLAVEGPGRAGLSGWRWPLAIAVGIVTLMGIVLGVFERGHSNASGALTVEQPSNAVSRQAMPVVSAVTTAPELPPVVPIERLPVAVTTSVVPVSGGPAPRAKPTESARPLVAVLPSSAPATLVQRPAPSAVDPFAARR